MKRVLFLIALMLVASCATTPTPLEYNFGDPGPRLKEPNQQVMDAVGRTLIDSWSAHYRICDPYKGWRKIPQLGGNGPVVYGWLVCGEVNAKNRSGGYTGWQPVAVFFGQGGPPNVEWGNIAFQWCGGENGGLFTPGRSSSNYNCPEIK